MPTVVSSDFTRLLDKRLSKVAEQTEKNFQSMIDTLFQRQGSDAAFEEYFHVTGVPDITEFTGKLSYLPVYPGFHKKVEHKTFANGIQFERKLIDDKKFNVFDNRGQLLLDAGYRTQEKWAARAWVNAFSSAFDFMESEEAVALCSDSHTTKTGVSTTTGFDNAGTSALDATSVAATRLAMRRFKNDLGQRMSVSDNLAIICPDALADAAREIYETDKGLDSSYGNKNVQAGRHRVIPYLRLDDYDTNNWFMVDMDALKRSLFWLDRNKPEITSAPDFETFGVKTALYMRYSWFWLDWRFIYGHQVS